EGGHPRDRPLVAVAARVDLTWVADAEPEEEAVVVRVGEHARGVRGGDRVARPDVRDARGDTDAVGRSEQHRAVRERLACAEALRVPERVVAERLDLTRSGSCVGRARDGEGADPDSDLAELHRRKIEPDRRFQELTAPRP